MNNTKEVNIILKIIGFHENMQTSEIIIALNKLAILLTRKDEFIISFLNGSLKKDLKEKNL